MFDLMLNFFYPFYNSNVYFRNYYVCNVHNYISLTGQPNTEVEEKIQDFDAQDPTKIRSP